MNALLQNIIIGVIANVTTTIFNQLGKSSKSILRNSIITNILNEATEEVAATLQPVTNVYSLEMERFLKSSEVEQIVRQIYSLDLTTKVSKESIREEFYQIMCLYIDIAEPDAREIGDLLFSGLSYCIQKVISKSIEEGILASHELNSIYRFRFLTDQLSTIEKNLEHLLGLNKANVQDILSFEHKYRSQVAKRHSFITPPNFDSARKVPIDQLFVPPNFVPISKGQNNSLILDMHSFFDTMYRTVVLGHPGGGKSTLSTRICYDLAKEGNLRIVGGRVLTPILVVIRDYGVEKKNHSVSILQFIKTVSNANYQIYPPDNAFEYLLLNGRAMVVFDGLDELIDISFRQEISSDIESFCNIYPSVPVLITSREVGYELAPLDEEMFNVFRLSDFDDAQVKNYISKFFSLDMDLKFEQKSEKVSSLFEETASISDIRSNPLMLALISNIYRGENYIPKNRPEVYAKCAEMLFERWDKGRGITVVLPFEAHISPAIKYLAFCIYTDVNLQGGIAESKLIKIASEYLLQKRFEDHDEAEKAATAFVEFCRGRAWVFTDIGTTESERLYKFTHTTFLEYFTAAYLVRIHVTPDSLFPVLEPKILNREWDVVAQLAFQIQHKHSEVAGDQLLSKLLDAAKKMSNIEKSNILSFATRCLRFIIPQPKITRLITIEAIDHCLDQKYAMDYPIEIVASLLSSCDENREAIASTLVNYFRHVIHSSEKDKAINALEVAMHSNIFERNSLVAKGKIDYWERKFDNIYHECFNTILNLAAFSPALATDLLHKGDLRISQFIEWYGIKAIFQDHRFSFFIGTVKSAIGIWSVYKLLLLESNNSIYEYFEEFGTIIIKEPANINKPKKPLSNAAWSHLLNQLKTTPVHEMKMGNMTELGILGLFYTIAMIIEISPEPNNFIYEFQRIFPLFGEALNHRLNDEQRSTVKPIKEFSNKNLIRFILKWCDKRINLVN